MKKLSNFKGSKLDLKEIKGGTYGPTVALMSGYFVPDYPEGTPGGQGNWNLLRPDVNDVVCY